MQNAIETGAATVISTPALEGLRGHLAIAQNGLDVAERASKAKFVTSANMADIVLVAQLGRAVPPVQPGKRAFTYEGGELKAPPGSFPHVLMAGMDLVKGKFNAQIDQDTADNLAPKRNEKDQEVFRLRARVKTFVFVTDTLVRYCRYVVNGLQREIDRQEAKAIAEAGAPDAVAAQKADTTPADAVLASILNLGETASAPAQVGSKPARREYTVVQTITHWARRNVGNDERRAGKNLDEVEIGVAIAVLEDGLALAYRNARKADLDISQADQLALGIDFLLGGLKDAGLADAKEATVRETVEGLLKPRGGKSPKGERKSRSPSEDAYHLTKGNREGRNTRGGDAAKKPFGAVSFALRIVASNHGVESLDTTEVQEAAKKALTETGVVEAEIFKVFAAAVADAKDNFSRQEAKKASDGGGRKGPADGEEKDPAVIAGVVAAERALEDEAKAKGNAFGKLAPKAPAEQLAAPPAG